MASKWLDTLKEEESKTTTIHNTTAALRESYACTPLPGDEKPRTPKNPTAKTAKTRVATRENLKNLENPTAKTAKTTKVVSEAEQLGLVATWSIEFGYVSIHGPLTGEWWDLQTKDAPDWAVREARKRKELY